MIMLDCYLQEGSLISSFLLLSMRLGCMIGCIARLIDCMVWYGRGFTATLGVGCSCRLLITMFVSMVFLLLASHSLF